MRVKKIYALSAALFLGLSLPSAAVRAEEPEEQTDRIKSSQNLRMIMPAEKSASAQSAEKKRKQTFLR